MLFDPKLVEWVQSGRKTVTRRPADGKPCGVRCGDIQGIQPGQGQPLAKGRIQITGVTLERLKDITDADARRQGYRGRRPRRDFMASWGDRYGGRSTQSVYRIEFVYMGDI